MKNLLEYIIKKIVSQPDKAQIKEAEDEEKIILELTVDPADMGAVIGKNGQTIRAIRKLLIVRAMAENKHVNLQLSESQQSESNINNQKTRQEFF